MGNSSSVQYKTEPHQIDFDALQHGEIVPLPAPNSIGIFAIVADWCGYCKKLKAEIDVAQQRVPFTYLRVDGDTLTPEQQKTLNIDGYPMVFTFGADGRLVHYTSPRTADALVETFKT